MVNEGRCLVCERVNTEEFFKELRERIGFDHQAAQDALKLLEATYFRYPLILCGRKRKVIKVAITYIIVLINDYKITQNQIAKVCAGFVPSYPYYNYPPLRDLARRIIHAWSETRTPYWPGLYVSVYKDKGLHNIKGFLDKGVDRV